MTALTDAFPTAKPEVVQKLEELLNVFGLDTDELHLKWETYAISLEPTEDGEIDISSRTDEFSQWLQQKQEQRPKKRQKALATPAKIITSRSAASTPNTSRDITTSSPSTPSTPNTPSTIASNGPNGTPHTPGLNIKTLNGRLNTDGEVATNVKVQVESDASAFEYRPMFQKLTAASRALDSQLESAIDRALEAQGLARSDLANAVHMSQSDLLVIGRICSEITDKNEITASAQDQTQEEMVGKAVLDNRLLALEMSRRIGAGMRVKLDVSALTHPAFFPGQIAMFSGSNPTGQCFIVKEMIDLPKFSPPANMSPPEKLVRIAVAAGPFTEKDSVDYHQLEKFVDIANDSSSLAVVIGPLVDDENSLVKAGKYSTPEQLLAEKVIPILNRLRRQFLYIPSIHDATFAHSVFPQPPMPVQGSLSIPNPGSILLEDSIVIAATSLPITRDILSNASGEMTQKIAFKHVLRQRRIYPVFPASSSDVSLDVAHLNLSDFADLPPNILISPGPQVSTSIVDNVICVNPGYCGLGTKTWARISFVPGTQLDSLLRQTRVDILPL